MSGATTTPLPVSARASEWGAVAVSLFALLLFGLAIGVALVVPSPNTLLVGLLTAAMTNATAVVNFWIGSSYGSAKKTAMLAAPPAEKGP